MKYQIVILPMALQEIEDAFRWLAERAPSRAIRWYNDLQNSIGTLQSFPRRCPLSPEADAFEREVRQLLFGKRSGRFRILFIIEERTVAVIHARHGARAALEPGTDDEE